MLLAKGRADCEETSHFNWLCQETAFCQPKFRSTRIKKNDFPLKQRS